MKITTIAELKRNAKDLAFEQVYNNIRRIGDPTEIAERVRGIRPVLSQKGDNLYIAVAKPFRDEVPHGAMLTIPRAKHCTFTYLSDEDKTLMTVTHEQSDWVIKYKLCRKELAE